MHANTTPVFITQDQYLKSTERSRCLCECNTSSKDSLEAATAKGNVEGPGFLGLASPITSQVVLRGLCESSRPARLIER